jgi:hypothetical protein
MQGLDAIGGLLDLKTQVFQNTAGDFPDHTAVIDHKAAFHGFQAPSRRSRARPEPGEEIARRKHVSHETLPHG